MQPLPSWLEASLNHPYQIIPRIEWSPDWETWFPLRPLSGSHQQSRTQQTRWTCSGTFVKDYTVGERGLHPYGPRMRIFLGIKAVRQPVIWIPQGQYSITSAEEDESAISLGGSSFETDVIDTDFVQVRRIPDRRNLSYRTQAEILIREAVPDARFYWDERLNYNEPIPTAYFNEGRWSVIDGRDQDISIMGALGGEAYCDASGGFHFVPTPTLDDAPVWRVGKGGALVSQTRSFDRAGVFNVVGAGGDSSDGQKSVGPVWAWDDEPTSITYAGVNPVIRPGVGAAKFGVKPMHYSNALIENEVQAGIAARAQLANALGLHYAVSLTSRYHPGVEAGDVIESETYDDRIERHLLDTISYTWGAADLSCEVRSPKEAHSSSALRRVNTRISVSDEIPLEEPEEETGDPPVDPGEQSGTVSFTATGGRAFRSNGSSRSTSRMYQGYYDSTNGNQKSMISFDYAAIQTALAGRNVTGVTLKFRCQFSYYNAGMTAVIGTHNRPDDTAAWSHANTNREKQSGMQAGEWATVSLGSAIANEFKDNTAKGVVFGPGPSTSKQYYGYMYLSSRPVLTFTYAATS